MSAIVNIQCGILTVDRSGPLDDSAKFPGLRPVDGHLDVIDTEIVSMCLTSAAGIHLAAGWMQGLFRHSYGAVAEKAGDPTIGESFFDVYFRVETPMGTLWNHAPMRVQADITCAPPAGKYIHITGCVALYDAEFGGNHVANLVEAIHTVNVPAAPAWGIVALASLMAAAAALAILRRAQNRA